MKLNQFCPDCCETTPFIKVIRSEKFNVKNEIEITGKRHINITT